MTDTERKRLAAILGMLGSDAVGERDNAARLAEQFRKQQGLTWAEMLGGDGEPPPAYHKPDPPSPPPSAPTMRTCPYTLWDRWPALALGIVPLVLFFILLNALF